MTNRLQYLFTAYIDRSATTAEKQELWELIKQPEHAEEIQAVIGEAMENAGSHYEIPEELAEKIFYRVVEGEKSFVAPVVHRVHFLKTSWFRYAAAVILLIGGAVTWYELSQHSTPSSSPQARISPGINNIAPGSNKAVLTVGNKKIDLASDKTGITVGSTVTYTDGSEVLNLVQHDGSGGAQDDGALGGVRQMELKTPRGGQYRALLPDGSRVWLNAASIIKFPSKFTGSTREVQINGEAYLEIAKNTKQPFIVKTNKTTVEVLGTSFNVNSYEDEETEKTTLIEGSVRVSQIPLIKGNVGGYSPNQGVILTPGQQAEIQSANNNKIKVTDNQSEAATAWKNGLFNFNGLDLKAVIHQMERWYDVDIEIEGKMPQMIFKGKMGRDLNLSEVLSFLSRLGLTYSIEGRKIVMSGKP